jgi:hypothetical protein
MNVTFFTTGKLPSVIDAFSVSTKSHKNENIAKSTVYRLLRLRSTLDMLLQRVATKYLVTPIIAAFSLERNESAANTE